MTRASEGKYKMPTPQRLKRLLVLEKKRRGVSADSLVFVGMHNIAQYHWCAMYAVLKSRKNELLFFGSYINDRVKYSIELGLIERIPRSDLALLGAGNDIGIEDVELLLEAMPKPNVDNDLRMQLGGSDVANGPPKGTMFHLEGNAAMIAGSRLETIKAERYPAVRWNFDIGKYVVVGIPDGITDDFVYEFKTTSKRFFLKFDRPVASIQADLYGYFFGRHNKRIQIYIQEDGTTETYEDKVDISSAEAVLKKFGDVDAGWSPPLPAPWKCRSCECRKDCPIVQ